MRLTRWPLLRGAMHPCKLMLLCVLALMLATPAFGFCFEPHPSVACDFLNSAAVFTGKVVSVRPEEEGGFTDGWYYRLSVLQLFRGPHQEVIEVYTGNDSGRYPLEVGEQYLIFAYVYEKRLEIDNCGDSVPLSKAREAVGQIEKISIPKDGIVEGQVTLENERRIPAEDGLRGIRVFIHGGGKTFSTVTSDRGWFRVHVRPGVYSAEARSDPGQQIVESDLSHDQPKSFIVRSGRCVELQFVAGPVNMH